jgi:hypothetical protein
MIWHIFKKDLRLLWPIAVILAAVELLNAGLLASAGQFSRAAMSGSTEYGWVSNNAVPLISLIGLVILVIAVIQQDRLTGTTQDWLTRPVRRGQLLAAKMLFIVLVGLGPIFLADLWTGVAEHLHLIDVIEASVTRTFMLYSLICLPAVMVGAVAHSFTGALLFSLALLVTLLFEFIVLASSRAPMPLLQGGSGFAWVAVVVLIVANLAAAILALPLQLRWRSTNRVRWMLLGYFIVAPAILCLPLGAAFQIQKAFDHDNRGTFPLEFDGSHPIIFSLGDERMPARVRPHPTFAVVAVPVVAPNRTEGETWQIDHARLQVIGAKGDSSTVSSIAYFEPAGLRSLASGVTDRLVFNVPIELFQMARDGHAKVKATLFLTAFELVAKKPVQALVGGSIDEFSQCRQRTSRFGGMVHCVSTRPVASCIQYESASRNAHVPAGRMFACRGASYAPWPLPLWRDAYYTVELGAAVPMEYEAVVAASDGMTVESEKTDKKTIVSNYAPESHFSRSIVFTADAAIEGSLHDTDKSIDGVGAAARFAGPVSMATDRHGNMFIADNDDVIRKVTAAGEVTTFAGLAGEAGWKDGRGPDARFKTPRGIAVDAADNVYVADTGNHLIRKISPAGIVSTLAGNPDASAASGKEWLRDPTSITVAPDGALYVIDHNEDHKPVLLKISPDGAVSKVAGPDTR